MIHPNIINITSLIGGIARSVIDFVALEGHIE